MRVVRIEGALKQGLFRILIFGYKTVFNPFNATIYTVERYVSERLVKHESIHAEQVERLGKLRFVWEVVKQSITHFGWKNTPLEQEAIERQYE